MGKLHEILAVEPDLAGETNKVLAEAIDTFAHKQEHFLGTTKSLKMFDENRAHEEGTTEQKELTTTVEDKLDYVQGAVARYWDAFFQKETTNQSAKGDIIIDGVSVAKDVPATALLGLETKLKSLRALYEAIPTLTPGIKWTEDPSLRKGRGRVYRDENKMTNKTEKIPMHKVLYEATKEHPAQIEKWNQDVPVGKFTVENVSGKMSVADKSKLLGRIDSLLRAVKQARMRANEAEASKVQIADKLFAFINA